MAGPGERDRIAQSLKTGRRGWSPQPKRWDWTWRERTLSHLPGDKANGSVWIGVWEDRGRMKDLCLMAPVFSR